MRELLRSPADAPRVVALLPLDIPPRLLQRLQLPRDPLVISPCLLQLLGERLSPLPLRLRCLARNLPRLLCPPRLVRVRTGWRLGLGLGLGVGSGLGWG